MTLLGLAVVMQGNFQLQILIFHALIFAIFRIQFRFIKCLYSELILAPVSGYGVSKEKNTA